MEICGLIFVFPTEKFLPKIIMAQILNLAALLSKSDTVCYCFEKKNI